MSADAYSPKKLIDQVWPADMAERIVGLLATTFELQPDFVETDFLPTIFSLGAWDDRSWASRIAIERRLADLQAAVIFQAAEQYRGRVRSLRVDIVPVPRTGNCILHAKVTILVGESTMRLVIASANLTEPGYRKNREVATVLEASAKRPAQTALIRDSLTSMKTALAPWWTDTADGLVEQALQLLASWPSPSPTDADEWFFWGGSELPLWRTFLEKWPKGERLNSIRIVSPFWSRVADGGPLEQFLDELEGRGLLDGRTALSLLTEAHPDTSMSFRPVLPESYAAFDVGHWGITGRAFPVDPTVSRDEIDGMDDARHRPLHAKVLMLEGASTSLAYIGSANFSRHGWGFLARPSEAHVEAGVILRRTGRHRDGLRSLLPPTSGKGVPLDGAAGGIVGVTEEQKTEVAWPVFVRGVSLVPEDSKSERLVIEADLDPSRIEAAWSIRIATVEGSKLNAVLLSGAGKGEGAVHVQRAELNPEQLARLISRKYVLIAWWGAAEPVEFPLNVDAVARELLPVAPEGGQPQEALLLQYYQSRITLEDLFPPPDDHDDRLGGSQDPVPGAPPDVVDTSNIQSYQIREFVEALRGIEEELKRASAAPASMRQALTGQVSPAALAKHVRDAVLAKKRSPTAGGFQLVELLACVGKARAFAIEGEHRDRWYVAVDEGRRRIEEYLNELRTFAPKDLRSAAPFRAFERAVRESLPDVVSQP